MSPLSRLLPLVLFLAVCWAQYGRGADRDKVDIYKDGFGYDPQTNVDLPYINSETPEKPRITDYPINQPPNKYPIPINSPPRVVTYSDPSILFKNEAEAREFVARLRPGLLFQEPVAKPEVILGWFYDRKGKYHSGIDYSKNPRDVRAGDDPTFEVNAIGDGRVVKILWNARIGNAVIVEHRGSGGVIIHSIYAHMRNGFEHDSTHARTEKPQLAPGDEGEFAAYQEYLKNLVADRALWGTETQNIQVHEGDIIRKGQLIGYAGNTGFQGVRSSLNPDGTVKSPYGGTHLHLTVAVSKQSNDPKVPQTEKGVFAHVDPYGIYSHNESGAYKPGMPSAFRSFFQEPGVTKFNHIPLSKLYGIYEYNSGLGMPIRFGFDFKVEFDQKGMPYASGQFNPDTGLKNFMSRVYTPLEDYKNYAKEFDRKGYRTNRLHVVVDPKGVHRVSANWQRKGPDEQSEWYVGPTAQWGPMRDSLSKQGYKVDQFMQYKGPKGEDYCYGFFRKGSPIGSRLGGQGRPQPDQAGQGQGNRNPGAGNGANRPAAKRKRAGSE